jgi:hypothetical protein
MKRISGVVLLLALFALPAFAAKNSHEFAVPDGAKIGDVDLPGGRCKVAWSEPSGSQVQLTITTENRKTFTVPAQLIEQKQNASAVQTFSENGVTYVKEFDTANFRFVVQEPSKGTK